MGRRGGELSSFFYRKQVATIIHNDRQTLHPHSRPGSPCRPGAAEAKTRHGAALRPVFSPCFQRPADRRRTWFGTDLSSTHRDVHSCSVGESGPRFTGTDRLTSATYSRWLVSDLRDCMCFGGHGNLFVSLNQRRWTTPWLTWTLDFNPHTIPHPQKNSCVWGFYRIRRKTCENPIELSNPCTKPRNLPYIPVIPHTMRLLVRCIFCSLLCMATVCVSMYSTAL